MRTGDGHSAAMMAANSASTTDSSVTVNGSVGGQHRAPLTAVIVGMVTSMNAQALMACRFSPLVVMLIFRGLACSATGIVSESTPP